MFITQRFDNILDWEQVALSASAQQLSALLSEKIGQSGAAAALTTGAAVSLCNNDVSATIYLGWKSSVSSSFYFAQLPPGKYLEELLSAGCIRQIWAIASSGTPNLGVTIFG